MEKKQVSEILKRINSNYPDFVVDEYKQKEWYNELKDYDYEDVMRKVEEHLRSEEYGKFPPKLYFLTKYLHTITEKNTKTNYLLKCSICGNDIPEAEYDNHYGRCMDIEYIDGILKKYFNKKVTKDMWQENINLSQEEFDIKYMNFLDKVYNRVPKEEQELIDGIINPPKIKFDLGDEEI